jgi:regulator of protease activity HflC (stomatin/prohibitin superfamily)
MMVFLVIAGVVLFLVVVLIFTRLRINREFERVVLFRLGRLGQTKGPGWYWQWARIIKAEGEQEAARNLAEAATLIANAPGALELRRLQTLTEIGAEHNSTVVAMIPSELLQTVKGLAGDS